MIVINDDVAINLDNVTSIEIDKESNTLGKLLDMEEDREMYGLYFNQVDGHGNLFQSYTKERAKEIFDDIITKWANKVCAVYVMPKE